MSLTNTKTNTQRHNSTKTQRHSDTMTLSHKKTQTTTLWPSHRQKHYGTKTNAQFRVVGYRLELVGFTCKGLGQGQGKEVGLGISG